MRDDASFSGQTRGGGTNWDSGTGRAFRLERRRGLLEETGPLDPSKLNRRSDVAGSNESSTNGQGSNARVGGFRKERRLTNGKQRRSSTPCLEVKQVVRHGLSSKLPGGACQRSTGLYSCRTFAPWRFPGKERLGAHSMSEIHASFLASEQLLSRMYPILVRVNHPFVES